MVLDHLHLVKATASSIRKNLPVHADYDDLVQAGIVGLIDAVNKFDAEKQNSFPTYAKHRIRGAILDNLRKLDWASRDMRRRQKLVAAAMNELTAILERTPSETEIADKARPGLDDLPPHHDGPAQRRPGLLLAVCERDRKIFLFLNSPAASKHAPISSVGVKNCAAFWLRP